MFWSRLVAAVILQVFDISGLASFVEGSTLSIFAIQSHYSDWSPLVVAVIITRTMENMNWCRSWFNETNHDLFSQSFCCFFKNTNFQLWMNQLNISLAETGNAGREKSSVNLHFGPKFSLNSRLGPTNCTENTTLSHFDEHVHKPAFL